MWCHHPSIGQRVGGGHQNVHFFFHQIRVRTPYSWRLIKHPPFRWEISKLRSRPPTSLPRKPPHEVPCGETKNSTVDTQVLQISRSSAREFHVGGSDEFQRLTKTVEDDTLHGQTRRPSAARKAPRLRGWPNRRPLLVGEHGRSAPRRFGAVSAVARGVRSEWIRCSERRSGWEFWWPTLRSRPNRSVRFAMPPLVITRPIGAVPSG